MMSTQFQIPRVLRFGTFEVDVSAGELRKNGIRVKLQQQPFQVLCMLAERPGEVVTRDDLRNRLWSADTFVDFDHGLNAAVKRLRGALGDTAENPRFIETLAKRGYRFLVPVNGQTVSAAPEAPTIAVLPAPTSIPAAKRRTLMIAGLVSLLLVGTALVWFVAHRVSPKAHPTEQRLTASSPDIPIRWATLSPDGKYLAYWDRTSLFLRLISTGETHALNLPSECIVPEWWDTLVLPGGWFPDSNYLLVTHCGAAGQPESVWSVSVLGGTPKEIMPDGEARAVSPDGSQITFVRAMGSGQSSQSLWVMDAHGSHVRKLAGQGGDSFGQVAWAPDNRRIAFIRYIYQPGYWHHAVLETYQVDNGVTNRILSEPLLESSLAWTHDNRLISAPRD
jgi:DNA-binding winged helix-turn-helix (wHTH) protein